MNKEIVDLCSKTRISQKILENRIENIFDNFPFKYLSKNKQKSNEKLDKIKDIHKKLIFQREENIKDLLSDNHAFAKVKSQYSRLSSKKFSEKLNSLTFEDKLKLRENLINEKLKLFQPESSKEMNNTSSLLSFNMNSKNELKSKCNIPHKNISIKKLLKELKQERASQDLLCERYATSQILFTQVNNFSRKRSLFDSINSEEVQTFFNPEFYNLVTLNYFMKNAASGGKFLRKQKFNISNNRNKINALLKMSNFTYDRNQNMN